MCGRFQLSVSWAQLLHMYGVDSPPPDGHAPSWSVCPTHLVPVLVRDDGERDLQLHRWGWPMSWLARQGKDPWSRPLINAKGEEARHKRTWSRAFREGRCVVPATAFIEWQRDGRERHPLAIARADGAPLHMAGLRSTFDRDGAPQPVVTVLTVGPSAEVARVHDRMPALLTDDALERWLDPDLDLDTAEDLLAPAPDGLLRLRELPHSINKAGYLREPPGPPDWSLDE